MLRSLLQRALRFVALAFLCLPALAGAPLGQTFTYQGRLIESGAPANGQYTLAFRLFDDDDAGAQIGSTITLNNVPVTDGLFTVALNAGGEFGSSAFNGGARWLEISVNGTKLAPRQPITVAPYSIYALNAWQLGGNAGIDSSKNFLGTSDDVPLEFRVNNQRVLRLTRNSYDPGFELLAGANVLAGSEVNSIEPSVVGATIAGGGITVDGDPSPNRVFDIGCTVGGGLLNEAGSDDGNPLTAWSATVAGGLSNRASGEDSTIAGGSENYASGFRSTVGGGGNNDADEQGATVAGGSSNDASGSYSAIGGGRDNTASESYATVSGGYSNTASGIEDTVCGGVRNEASGGGGVVVGGYNNLASGSHAVISGGSNNQASGEFSFIAAGERNSAGGDHSFVAGQHAKVRTADEVGGGDADGDEGTFVWADSTDADFKSTGPDQFLIRAAGGVGIGTNSPDNTLHVFKGSAGSITGNAKAPLIVENSGDAYVNILSPDANERGVLFGAPTDGTAAGGIIYNSSATPDGLQFRVNGNKTTMVIGSNGFVGIGTTNPDTPLDVKRNQNPPASFDRTGNDGAVVAIQQDGTTEGTISVSGNTVSYNAFTGSHFAWTDQPIARGTLVAMTGENRRFHDQMTSEIIYGIAATSRANDPACLGAFLGTLDASDPPGSDNPDLVMAVGNGEMWVVDDGRGDIHPGDYLIASDVPGCAMLDDAERFPIGHVVARAAEPVDWSQVARAADSARRVKISVLFVGFDRHSVAADLERVVERQQRELDELRARLVRLEMARNSPASSTGR